MAKLVKKVKLIMDFNDGFEISEEASVEDVLKKILATPASNSTKIKIDFDDESRSEYESDCTSTVDHTVTVEEEEEDEDNSLYTASNQPNPTLFI